MTNKVKLSIWAEVWDWTGCFFFFFFNVRSLNFEHYRSDIVLEYWIKPVLALCFSFPVLLTPQLLRLRFTAFPVYQVFRVF